MDEVVLVMAEGDLVAAEFLGEIEEQLAAVPGAEKAGLLLASFELCARLCRFALRRTLSFELYDIFVRCIVLINDLEAGSPDVEPNAEGVAEGLEIAGVRLVADVLHPHVQGLDGESGMLDE